MPKTYAVKVDGETEETTRKSEAVETVLDALQDGKTHRVALDVVEPEPAKEDEAPEEISNPDNPTAVTAGTEDGVPDAQGVPHIR